MAISNYQLMKALSKDMSTDFLGRLPEITKANMEQLGQTIENYPTIANEFVQVLTNQVIRTMFMTRALDNPLSIFEKGDLSKFGKSLEMIHVDIVKGKDFTERFGTSGTYEGEYLAPEKVDNVKVQYITENSRLKYKVTISNDMLASAFKNENGLSQLVNQLVSKMTDSYNYDKFLMTWKLIDMMPKVNIAGYDGSNEGINKERGQKLLKVIKKTIKDMRFPSKAFNTSGVYTESKPSDLVIIMDTNTTSTLDVDLLAGVFNLSKVEMASRIVEIPYFADKNTQAIICDRDKIQIYNTKYASDTVKNGAGLFTNVFMHRWDLLDSCGFANCVRIHNSSSSAKDPLTLAMPYDVIDKGVEIKEHTMEITEDGEIANKTEKKIKSKK